MLNNLQPEYLSMINHIFKKYEWYFYAIWVGLTVTVQTSIREVTGLNLGQEIAHSA
jgi:hypothetical protein